MISDIELMPIIRKSEFTLKRERMSFANQFCALAGQFRPASVASATRYRFVSHLRTRHNRRNRMDTLHHHPKQN